MRKVILLVMVTLDGFFDGPGEGLEKIDWHHADAEWEDYSVEILSGADTLLFGRKTYEGFAAFWPTQEGEVARLLNEIEKVVFSTTLTEATWQHTRLVREHVPGVVAELKDALRGEMTMTFTLTEADGGTDVLAVHDNLPPGVSPADNETGTRMALEKLARLVMLNFETPRSKRSLSELRRWARRSLRRPMKWVAAGSQPWLTQMATTFNS